MRDKSHDEYMIEVFRDEPEYAAFMVNSILEDGNDQGELKYIMEYIAAAGLRVSLAPATAAAKPRARARAGAAKTAAKRVKTAPAAKRAPAAKPTKRAAPATKRARTAPTALPAGTGRSRPAMAAAGA